MRFLIVLAMLAAVALANPLINIRVNVDSQPGLPPGPPGPYPPPGPGPYPPPPGPDPEQPPPQPYRKDVLEPAALPADSDVVYPINEAAAPLVNIEVFVDNQRQGNIPIVPEYPPPPQPY